MLPSLFLSQGGPKTHPGCLPHFPAFPMAGPLLPSPSGPDQALPSPARHLSQPPPWARGLLSNLQTIPLRAAMAPQDTQDSLSASIRLARLRPSAAPFLTSWCSSPQRPRAHPWLASLAVPAFAHAAPSARHRLSPPSFLLLVPIYPQGLCSESPLQQAPFPGWSKHRLWAPTASRPSPILALAPQPAHTPPAPSPALTTLGDLCLRSGRGTWDCSSFTPIHTCHTFDTPNSKPRTSLVLLPRLCSCGAPWLGCPSDLPGILPSPLTTLPV